MQSGRSWTKSRLKLTFGTRMSMTIDAHLGVVPCEGMRCQVVGVVSVGRPPWFGTIKDMQVSVVPRVTQMVKPLWIWRDLERSGIWVLNSYSRNSSCSVMFPSVISHLSPTSRDCCIIRPCLPLSPVCLPFVFHHHSPLSSIVSC